MSLRLATASRWAAAAAALVLFPLEPLSLWPVSVALIAIPAALQALPARVRPYEPGLALLSLGGLALAAAGAFGSHLAAALLAAVVLTVLTLPWLDSSLRLTPAPSGEHISSSPLLAAVLRGPRGLTGRAAGLLGGLATEAVVAAVAGQPALAASAGVVMLFLAGRAATAEIRIPSRPLDTEPPLVRVVVGEPVQAASRLLSRSPLPLTVLLDPGDPRVTLSPSLVGVDRVAEVQLRLIPERAGPLPVRATAWAVDPWGLAGVRQHIDLASLHVIPRSAYAAWLAQRYLERTVPGVSGPVPAAAESQRTPLQRRGVEYRGARFYEPGDELREIFWKASARLRRTVVKDRRDDPGTPVALLIDLDTRTEDDADWLASAIVMAALTLAQEGVPLAFGAYSREAEASVTPLQSPRDAVRTALDLTARIRRVTGGVRVLGPLPFRTVRRRIMKLEAASSGPAERLAHLFRIEMEALRARARTHPATAVLHRLTALVPGTVGILPLAATLDDSDIVDFVVETLRGRGVEAFPRLTPGAERGLPEVRLARTAHRRVS
jgi:uncharacterized protein (DUF58 family)